MFALVFGLACWLAFSRTQDSAAELPLLYLSAFGVSTFLGNLMSASFAGDFSNAAIALRLPATARYSVTLVGALSLIAVLFRVGGELRQWTPVGTGAVSGMAGIVALPVVVGTAVVILVNQPMPASFVGARVRTTVRGIPFVP